MLLFSPTPASGGGGSAGFEGGAMLPMVGAVLEDEVVVVEVPGEQAATRPASTASTVMFMGRFGVDAMMAFLPGLSTQYSIKSSMPSCSCNSLWIALVDQF